jgi:hypothetical protein
MPGTASVKLLWARKESRPGTDSSTELSPLDTSPIAKTEKGAGAAVCHRASAEAIFIGCCSNMTLPRVSPVRATPRPETTAMTRPTRSEVRIAATILRSTASPWPCFRRAFHRWWLATPTTRAAPVRKAAVRVCSTTTTVVLWNSTAVMLVSWALPVAGSMW